MSHQAHVSATGGKPNTKAVADLLGEGAIGETVRVRFLDAVPWIFRSAGEEYKSWRNAVATAANIAPTDVFLVGSAATGFSLAPEKLGRPFRPNESDLDVAIVNDALFTAAWNAVVHKHRVTGLPVPFPQLDGMQKGVYWGFLQQWHLPSGTPEARRLLQAVTATASSKPLYGHKTSCRLYRRREDLEGYWNNVLGKAAKALENSA